MTHDYLLKERYQLYHEEKAKGGIVLTMFRISDSISTPWSGPSSSAARRVK